MPTAVDAARAVACELCQIVRPLVFDGEWFAHFAFIRPPLDLGSDRSTMVACPNSPPPEVSRTAKFSGRGWDRISDLPRVNGERLGTGGH
jgi:hypothetical protein